MSRARVLLSVLLLALVPAGLALAAGAGGVGFGAQYYDAGLSNTDMGMAYITGYGYAVTRSGTRIGGFGTALLSLDQRIAGGAGGMVTGHEWRGGPLVAALTLWGGAGGCGYLGRGYLLVFGQVDFELGVKLLPWMQVVAYAGYQAWGNVLPGIPFSSAVLTTPVFGVRVGWGGF